METRRHSDIIGRLIGMLTFLFGVGLLGFVFYTAQGLFNAPADAALGLKFTGNPKTDPTTVQIGSQFGFLLFRIVYLVIMSIAGSLIAQKGINLYFSALHGHPVSITAKPLPNPPETITEVSP